jgi:eukaryotic-like serine/threonine-protein kinase
LDAVFSGTARYQVIRSLGRGGMGVVYEALDRERDQRVALKTMRRLEPQLLLRFKQEFRALKGLDHPNLVTFFDLVAEGGSSREAATILTSSAGSVA